MISFDNFRQVSKTLDKFIPAKKTFLQSFQYFSKLPPHGRTIAMGGTQPQVNDVNLAKAEWQQKQLQTWKKINNMLIGPLITWGFQSKN